MQQTPGKTTNLYECTDDWAAIYNLCFQVAFPGCRAILLDVEKAQEMAWDTAADFVLLLRSGWSWSEEPMEEIAALFGCRTRLLTSLADGDEKNLSTLLQKLARLRAGAEREQRRRDRRRFTQLGAEHDQIAQPGGLQFARRMETEQLMVLMLRKLDEVSPETRELLEAALGAGETQARRAAKAGVSPATMSRRMNHACLEMRQALSTSAG